MGVAGAGPGRAGCLALYGTRWFLWMGAAVRAGYGVGSGGMVMSMCHVVFRSMLMGWWALGQMRSHWWFSSISPPSVAIVSKACRLCLMILSHLHTYPFPYSVPSPHSVLLQHQELSRHQYYSLYVLTLSRSLDYTDLVHTIAFKSLYRREPPNNLRKPPRSTAITPPYHTPNPARAPSFAAERRTAPRPTRAGGFRARCASCAAAAGIDPGPL